MPLIFKRSLLASSILMIVGCDQQTSLYSTETLVFRELSVKTFAGTLNDDKDHPVMQVDNLDAPKPIGPGRGAGTWVFINNKLVDYDTGEDRGVMRGSCWTLNHGEDGPWTGALWIGEGGPYNSDCKLIYVLEEGQIVATGDVDMNLVEQDAPAEMAVIGGTGRYRSAGGEVVFQQDPPGQPITYKVTISVDLPAQPDSNKN